MFKRILTIAIDAAFLALFLGLLYWMLVIFDSWIN